MKRTLYFEGAGCVPRGEVENCRIRTAYKNKNGEIVYLEMSGIDTAYEFGTDKKGNRVERNINGAFGFVHHCHKAKLEKDLISGEMRWTDCNKYNYGYPLRARENVNYTFEYTKAGILEMVNNYFDGDFDEIVILPRLAGYRVHADKYSREKCPYNLMDDFVYDIARTQQAEKIEQYFYDFEKNVLGKKYPNFSIYFEDNILKVLIHYNGFNDTLEIANVFEYKFDYQKPIGATVVK